MLVLSRRIDEVLVIGSSIRVTVIEINGRRVRLGIAAPAETTVLRGELSARDFETGKTPITERPNDSTRSPLRTDATQAPRSGNSHG